MLKGNIFSPTNDASLNRSTIKFNISLINCGLDDLMVSGDNIYIN